VRTPSYLIDDLFDMSRLATGKLSLDLSKIRIQDTAREALSIVQPAAGQKKLRISTDISEAVPPCLADPQRIRQILTNLLNNAVKFTPPGGTIALRISRHGNHVECTVSDSGRGIAPEFLPYVFDRFRQESRFQRAKTGGLGLGLAIVRELVELHGGVVTAHSPGCDLGSTFKVRLPLRNNN
jgi:signal transduction histidine kinase